MKKMIMRGQNSCLLGACCLLATASAMAQNSKKPSPAPKFGISRPDATDLEKLELKGKVKQLTVTTNTHHLLLAGANQSYNDKIDSFVLAADTLQASHWRHGSKRYAVILPVTEVETEWFDARGRRTKAEKWINGQLDGRREYSYDKTGRLVHYTVLANQTMKGENRRSYASLTTAQLRYKGDTIFTSNVIINEVDTVYVSGHEVLNKQGRTILEVQGDTFHTQYDHWGRMIAVSKGAATNRPDQQWIYSDSSIVMQGPNTQTVSYYRPASGILRRHELRMMNNGIAQAPSNWRLFDKQGRVVRNEFVRRNAPVNRVFTYRYEEDAKGNWIRQQMERNDGRPGDVVEREIVLYTK